MPAKDIYHDTVRNAFIVKYGRKDLYVDLGAEQALGAEKEGRKIAVEVKSFTGPSEAFNLELSLGQFFLYRNILRRSEPERVLYLALREAAYQDVFDIPDGRKLIEEEALRLIVFDEWQEVIVKWIS